MSWTPCEHSSCCIQASTCDGDPTKSRYGFNKRTVKGQVEAQLFMKTMHNPAKVRIMSPGEDPPTGYDHVYGIQHDEATPSAGSMQIVVGDWFPVDHDLPKVKVYRQGGYLSILADEPEDWTKVVCNFTPNS